MHSRDGNQTHEDPLLYIRDDPTVGYFDSVYVMKTIYFSFMSIFHLVNTWAVHSGWISEEEPRQTLPVAFFTVLDSIKFNSLKVIFILFFLDLIYSKQVVRQRYPSSRLPLDWKEKHEYENKDTIQRSAKINGRKSL